MFCNKYKIEIKELKDRVDSLNNRLVYLNYELTECKNMKKNLTKKIKEIDKTIETNKVGRRLKNIADYVFPSYIKEESSLSVNEYKIIEDTLRLHFEYIKRNHKTIEAVNTYVDDLWRLFLIDTKEYEKFCNDYIGFFVHHKYNNDIVNTPNEIKKTVMDGYLDAVTFNYRLKSRIIDNKNIISYLKEDDTLLYVLIPTLINNSVNDNSNNSGRLYNNDVNQKDDSTDSFTVNSHHGYTSSNSQSDSNSSYSSHDSGHDSSYDSNSSYSDSSF